MSGYGGLNRVDRSKDNSGFSPQQRHDVIMAKLSEFGKGPQAFQLRWRENSGDLLTAETLLKTPMFWYMKYKWSRCQIESLFFAARVEISSTLNMELHYTFGGDSGPRWKGGGGVKGKPHIHKPDQSITRMDIDPNDTKMKPLMNIEANDVIDLKLMLTFPIFVENPDKSGTNSNKRVENKTHPAILKPQTLCRIHNKPTILRQLLPRNEIIGPFDRVDVFGLSFFFAIVLQDGPPSFEHARENDKNCGLLQSESDLITRMLCFDPDNRTSIQLQSKKHSWYRQKDEMLTNSDLIKVLRHRHQRMEQQRNADPNKQTILQRSVRRPLVQRILSVVAAADKTPNDLPPLLPPNEIINPFDIYTSTLLTAYEVLQGLEDTITNALKGNVLKPSYNQMDAVHMNGDNNADESNFDGTHIDVVNFSLLFSVALQDLDAYDGQMVYVHIALYHDKEAECNLVKFTRLSGEREAFEKIIDHLSTKAANILTGLDTKSTKKLNCDNKFPSQLQYSSPEERESCTCLSWFLSLFSLYFSRFH